MNKIAEQEIKEALFKEAYAKRELQKKAYVHRFLFDGAKAVIKTQQLTVPEIGEPKQEAMPEPVDFVPKKTNQKRRLIRAKPTPRLGTVEERLQKAANKLDEIGEQMIANKIDKLLRKISERKNV